MNRSILLTLVWSVALALGACAEEKMRYEDNGWVDYYDYCGQFTSCEQCTPMEGCGWCSYGRGQGFCFSEPNQCQTPIFSWTWVPEGCGNAFDSGIERSDAAMNGGDSGSPPEDAATRDGSAGDN